VRILIQKNSFRKWQALVTVLFFVFLTGVSHGGVAEDLAGGKPLPEVIEDGLVQNTAVSSLVADLVAAGEHGRDIIDGMFDAGATKYDVIAAALDCGLDSSAVAWWADECGATMEEIQAGFGMAGVDLPPGMVFLNTRTFEDNTGEYLYNSPSQSN
jgi:hypothetical protein